MQTAKKIESADDAVEFLKELEFQGNHHRKVLGETFSSVDGNIQKEFYCVRSTKLLPGFFVYTRLSWGKPGVILGLSFNKPGKRE